MNASELNILIPAFVAGLLVLSTHIPFGMKILERGVIFADLAVAQIAGLGVIIAGLLDLTGEMLGELVRRQPRNLVGLTTAQDNEQGKQHCNSKHRSTSIASASRRVKGPSHALFCWQLAAMHLS